MTLAPKEQTRIAVKFWLDCLQVVIVIVAVITVAITVIKYRNEQKAAAAAQAERAIEQDRQAHEQIQAIKRELRRPYQEKKLDLYIETSKVLAHLSMTPDVEFEKYKARFWELYWGELAFVESTTAAETTGGPNPSVERLMVQFCHQMFSDECLKQQSADGSSKMRNAPAAAAAIGFARQASKEIRQEWENLDR
jgi:hypothetical protein